MKSLKILYSLYWDCYPVSPKRTYFLFLLCFPSGPAVVTFWLTWYQYSANYFGSCSSPSMFYLPADVKYNLLVRVLADKAMLFYLALLERIHCFLIGFQLQIMPWSTFHSVCVVPHSTMMSNFSNDNSFTNSAARETCRSLWLCAHKIFCLELCYSCLRKSGATLSNIFPLCIYIGGNKICRLTRSYKARGASQRINENNGVFFYFTLWGLSAETAFPMYCICDIYALLLKYFWKLMEC